jgi:hypothetical protein
MDSQPPNDPNRGNNNNHNNRPAAAKEVPYDGRQRGGRQRRDGSAQRDGETMDVMGDLRESPAVVMMFLIGVASWLLREKCIC